MAGRQLEAAELLLAAQADPLKLCTAPGLGMAPPPAAAAADEGAHGESPTSNGEETAAAAAGADGLDTGTAATPQAESASTAAAVEASDGGAPWQTTVAHMLLGNGGGLFLGPWEPEEYQERYLKLLDGCMTAVLTVERLDEKKDVVPLPLVLNTTVNSAGEWGLRLLLLSCHGLCW